MRSTGMYRKVDRLGRIVIPVEIREGYNIKTGDTIDISVEENKIILRKINSGCIFCGSEKNTIMFGEGLVCRKCVEKLKSI